MIKIGCVCTHPDDASFLRSDAVSQWASRFNRWALEMLPHVFDASSVDVLLLPEKELNKTLLESVLPNKPWVLLSSRKADALKAWQLGAAYFLLRPFSTDDLLCALERAEQIHYWNLGLAPPEQDAKTLVLHKTKGRRVSVRFDDILFFEANGEITEVYLDIPGQEKITATRHLGHWVKQMKSSGFVRIHKKFFVNINHVSGMEGSDIQIRNFNLPVAKRRKRFVEDQLFRLQNLTASPVNALLNGMQVPFMKKI